MSKCVRGQAISRQDKPDLVWVEAKGRKPGGLNIEINTDFLPTFPWKNQGHFQWTWQRIQVSIDQQFKYVNLEVLGKPKCIMHSKNLRREWWKGHFAVCTWTATVTEWHQRALTFVLSILPTGINQLSFFIVSGHSSLSKTTTPTWGLWRLVPIRPSFFYHWGPAFLAACAITWLSSHFPIWMWMSLIQFAHMISQTQEGTHLDAERCNHYYHCGKESPSLVWVKFFYIRRWAHVIHFGGAFHFFWQMPICLGFLENTIFQPNRALVYAYLGFQTLGTSHPLIQHLCLQVIPFSRESKKFCAFLK